MELRFIHTADWHLGHPYAGWPRAASQQLIALQQEACLEIVQRCEAQQIPLLLIAGDLFDRPDPPERLVRQVVDWFGQLSSTDVAICPGNHDPYNRQSPWVSADWPVHVHILKPDRQPIRLRHLQTVVYGTPFCSQIAPQPLEISQPDPQGQDWQILLQHGEWRAGSGGRYNPLDQNLLHAGFDYLALGHRHQAERAATTSETAWAYSGCPMGRDSTEQGRKGYWLGRLMPAASGQGRAHCQLLFQTVPGMRFESCRVLLDGRTFEDSADLTAFILQNSGRMMSAAAEQPWRLTEQQTSQHRDNAMRAPDGQRDVHKPLDSDDQPVVLRIELAGHTPADLSPLLPGAERLLAAHWFSVTLVDQTVPQSDWEQLAQSETLAGLFARRVLAFAGQEQERELVERAARFAAQAFSDEVIIDADY